MTSLHFSAWSVIRGSNSVGFQTNLMVQKPGGYVFSDYAKVGIPLTIIIGAVVLLLAPVVYGF